MSSDGTIVAVGAHRNDGAGSDAGHVRVFEWDAGMSSWGQLGGDIDGEAEGDRLGLRCRCRRRHQVAIGARFNDGAGSDAGHVRVYGWNAGTSSWDQKGGDIDGEAAGDGSGFSVAMSPDGTRVAIGARSNGGAGSDAGHVRVYSVEEIVSITYDSQGGSVVADGDVTTMVGGSITALPTDPTRAGFTFEGWFTATSGGSQVTVDAAHNPTADLPCLRSGLRTRPPTTTTTTTTTAAPATTTTSTTAAPTHNDLNDDDCCRPRRLRRRLLHRPPRLRRLRLLCRRRRLFPWWSRQCRLLGRLNRRWQRLPLLGSDQFVSPPTDAMVVPGCGLPRGLV